MRSSIAIAATCIGVLACTNNTHPPGITGGGTGGGGTGTAAASDAAVDTATSDASTLSITGKVKQLTSLARDPSSGTTPPVGVGVRATDATGTTVNVTTDSVGSYSLTNVGLVAPLTWLEVVTTTRVVTVFGFNVPSGTLTLPNTDLPYWGDDIILAAANQCAVTAPLASTATLVVQVTDGSGRLITGATADGFRATNPCYDDGVDLSATPKSTGSNGTIAFFAVATDAAPAPVVVRSGSKSTSIMPELIANAVTFVRAVIP